MPDRSDAPVEISSKGFLIACAALSLLIVALTGGSPIHPNWVGLEVFLTVIALFVFGSIRYRIDKNAITYGAILVISATFFPIWWPTSYLRQEMAQRGGTAFLEAVYANIFSLHQLEKLIHADTMLFILGLTFFVSVISQTRFLEAISMYLLTVFKGRLFVTILVIMGLVSLASGILDGVSMIGLLIRILMVILVVSRIKRQKIEFLITSSVVITTVCGMWLAYGEPPNLIMKSNLGLSDIFFLQYAMPMAAGTFAVVALFLYRRLRGETLPIAKLDILERRIADVRFLQVKRYGEIREMESDRGKKQSTLFIEAYLGREYVEPVSAYYRDPALGGALLRLLDEVHIERRTAQKWGILSFLPFIGLLLWHSADHDVPLFLSSFVAFLCAFLGIVSHPKMRRLALHEAVEESKEYLFLFPLFLSITMLTAIGFFDQMKTLIEEATLRIGRGHVAVIQFVGANLLSAMLDNNVVADFASRAIDGMPNMFLFAAAQIAGYATGGSLTHIGCAQSVVAFAYILRNVDPHFTPWDWILAMWKLGLVMSIALIAMIYVMAAVIP